MKHYSYKWENNSNESASEMEKNLEASFIEDSLIFNILDDIFYRKSSTMYFCPNGLNVRGKTIFGQSDVVYLRKVV